MSVAKPALLCLLTLCSACQEPITQDECGLLLDRYTEKVIDQSRPSTLAGERARLIEQARIKAARDPEFQECTSRVTRSKFECAMKAPDADEMERCLL